MCTTFVLKNEKSLLLGQNYDYFFGHGMISVNPRGLKKTAITMPGKKGAAWTAKYGNVTFNQYGRELPTSGMNEQGLAIAMMWHDDGEYPEPDARPILNELQWIQYQLDLYATVEEVLDRLDDIRIEKAMTVLHYMVVDATGDAAVIEFHGGQPRIARGVQARAATNSGIKPSLRHAESLRNTPLEDLSGRLDSLNRYALTCRLVEDACQAAGETPLGATEAFTVLQNIAISPSTDAEWVWEGMNVPPTLTQWRIVFDVRRRIVHYETQGNPHVCHFALDRFSFSAGEPALCLALDGALSGDTGPQFKPYSREDNERIVRLSFAPVADRFPPMFQHMLAAYPESFK